MDARAAGIVYLVGAGPGRSRPADPPRGGGPGAGRRGRLRPSGQPPPARPRPRVGLADLRGQVDRPLHAVAGRDQPAPGRARPRGPAGGPAQGGRPVRLRPGAEEAEHLRAAGIAFRGRAGGDGGGRRDRLRRHPDHAPRRRPRPSPSSPATTTPRPPPARRRLDWAALARFPGTLVVYMGVTRLAGLCRTLIRAGQARRRRPPR